MTVWVVVAREWPLYGHVPVYRVASVFLDEAAANDAAKQMESSSCRPSVERHETA